jgi:glycerophosphoryl diester phosphodiesterase
VKIRIGFIKVSTLVLALLLVLIFVLSIRWNNTANFPLNQGKPLIFMHRGMAQYAAENSKEGFQKTLQAGFNAVETDIRLTRDKQLIICHDDNGKRLLGISDSLKNLTLEELQQYPILYKKQATENHILKLEDAIVQFKDSLFFYLDIKEKNKLMGDSLVALFERYQLYDKALVASTNFLFAARLKWKEPKIKVALEGFNAGKGWLYYIIPARIKPDYYSGFLHKTNARQTRFLNRNHLMPYRIVYGVDSTNLNQVYTLSIQHIIIDYKNSMGTLADMQEALIKASLKK